MKSRSDVAVLSRRAGFTVLLFLLFFAGCENKPEFPTDVARQANPNGEDRPMQPPPPEPPAWGLFSVPSSRFSEVLENNITMITPNWGADGSYGWDYRTQGPPHGCSKIVSFLELAKNATSQGRTFSLVLFSPDVRLYNWAGQKNPADPTDTQTVSRSKAELDTLFKKIRETVPVVSSLKVGVWFNELWANLSEPYPLGGGYFAIADSFKAVTDYIHQLAHQNSMSVYVATDQQGYSWYFSYADVLMSTSYGEGSYSNSPHVPPFNWSQKQDFINSLKSASGMNVCPLVGSQFWDHTFFGGDGSWGWPSEAEIETYAQLAYSNYPTMVWFYDGWIGDPGLDNFSNPSPPTQVQKCYSVISCWGRICP